MIILAASLAISVPLIPIANPILAFFNNGPSPVPSPVAATVYPLSYRPVIKVNLSYGLAKAKTCSWG